MIKVGDRVLVISCNEIGRVHRIDCAGYASVIVVKLDNVKKFIPKIKNRPKTKIPDEVYFHAGEDDVRLLESASGNDDWKDIWDSGAT